MDVNNIIKYFDSKEIILFKYQISNIIDILKIENEIRTTKFDINIRILGNDVGSGKTRIILCSILYDNDHITHSFSNYENNFLNNSMNNVFNELKKILINNLINKEIKSNILTNEINNFRTLINNKIINIDEYNIINKTLIVFPFHLIKQWKDECDYLNLKYIIITSNTKLSDYINNDEEIILCKNTMLKYLVFNENILYKRIVIDDSCSIKIDKKMIEKLNNSSYYFWHLSATYKKIPQKWNINNILLEKYLVKTQSEIIKKEFIIKNYKKCIKICTRDSYLDLISDYLNSEQINLLNSDCIDAVINSLCCEIINPKNLVLSITNKYTEEINILEKELEIYKIKKNNEKINIIENNIKSIEKRLYEISQKIKNLENDMCSICLDKYEKPVLVDCCKNIFCTLCILNWEKHKKTCPLCRKKININTDIKVISEKIIINSNKIKNKIDECIEYCLNNKNKKILIFSNYDDTYNQLNNVFRKNDICLDILKGNGIQKKIEKFKKDYNNNILFMNSSNFGSGLNLENTDTIILYHNLNEDLLTQVIGRAFRLNRKKILEVIQLKYINEED